MSIEIILINIKKVLDKLYCTYYIDCKFNNHIYREGSMKTINEIIQAQDALKNKFGDTDYQKLITAIKNKSNNNLLVLRAMAKDNSLSAIIRLGAIACMGE